MKVIKAAMKETGLQDAALIDHLNRKHARVYRWKCHCPGASQDVGEAIADRLGEHTISFFGHHAWQYPRVDKHGDDAVNIVGYACCYLDEDIGKLQHTVQKWVTTSFPVEKCDIETPGQCPKCGTWADVYGETIDCPKCGAV